MLWARAPTCDEWRMDWVGPFNQSRVQNGRWDERTPVCEEEDLSQSPRPLPPDHRRCISLQEGKMDDMTRTEIQSSGSETYIAIQPVDAILSWNVLRVDRMHSKVSKIHAWKWTGSEPFLCAQEWVNTYGLRSWCWASSPPWLRQAECWAFRSGSSGDWGPSPWCSSPKSLGEGWDSPGWCRFECNGNISATQHNKISACEDKIRTMDFIIDEVCYVCALRLDLHYMVGVTCLFAHAHITFSKSLFEGSSSSPGCCCACWLKKQRIFEFVTIFWHFYIFRKNTANSNSK